LVLVKFAMVYFISDIALFEFVSSEPVMVFFTEKTFGFNFASVFDTDCRHAVLDF
jgi:hypothetical protein